MTITPTDIHTFADTLAQEERSPATIEKYCRALSQFAAWLGDSQLSKSAVSDWKAALLAAGHQPTTVNGKLTALDRWLTLCGRSDCKTAHLRLQRRLFRDTARDLSKDDYHRLVTAAQTSGHARLALLIETLGATGMRVSELRHITLDAVQRRRATISLKGKIRTILLPAQLCRKLEKFARRQHITSGVLFRTASGRPLSRQQIWAEMKALCRRAGIPPEKVYPHNLRHLFARTYYKAARDIAQLADVLGHSSIETTRIYLRTTSTEHARTLDRLALVSPDNPPPNEKRHPRRGVLKKFALIQRAPSGNVQTLQQSVRGSLRPVGRSS